MKKRVVKVKKNDEAILLVGIESINVMNCIYWEC